LPPHPHPLPAGERGRVRGNFKYVWSVFSRYLKGGVKRIKILPFEEVYLFNGAITMPEIENL